MEERVLAKAESEAKKAVAMEDKLSKMKKKANKAKLAAAKYTDKTSSRGRKGRRKKGEMGAEAEMEIIDLCSPVDIHEQKNGSAAASKNPKVPMLLP